MIDPIMFTDPSTATIHTILVVGIVLALIAGIALKPSNKKLHKQNAAQRKRLGY